jgi:hypothetical protein
VVAANYGGGFAESDTVALLMSVVALQKVAVGFNNVDRICGDTDG